LILASNEVLASMPRIRRRRAQRPDRHDEVVPSQVRSHLIALPPRRGRLVAQRRGELVDLGTTQSLVGGGASQPARRERVRHQDPDAVPVERTDEKK
jgi:hypothetical protein